MALDTELIAVGCFFSRHTPRGGATDYVAFSIIAYLELPFFPRSQCAI